MSTQEHIDRLCAARLQADMMGTETLVVARTDAEAATLVDTNIDKSNFPPPPLQLCVCVCVFLC